MPRDGELSEQLATAFDLRRRASRVRRLMGGMISKADYDRLRDYVESLEKQAAELEEEHRAIAELRA
jgi:hypothetical protein